MSGDTQFNASEPSTSASLVVRVKHNDPQAWQRLVAIYSPLVYTWCRRHSLAAHDAADILQEVFRAVHRQIGSFRRERPDDTFRGWLWTITRNKVRDHFRAQQHRPQATGGTDAQLRFADLPDQEPVLSEATGVSAAGSSPYHAALELVRTEFEDRTWQAFWRAAIDEQPTDQIAADLGMSVNAVRLAKSRVLRRLRTEFEGLLD
jgi:RNA polymerase sigma-70 factor (ECF subfamily)